VMTKKAEGQWEVASKHSRVIHVTAQVPPDPEIMKLAKPYQEETEKYLDTPIATSTKDLSGKHARYEDSPLLDVVQNTEMDAGQADVSMATLFYQAVRIPAGAVTVRQAAALYVYDNTLYVVQMTGAQLKEALEHAASFFSQWPLREGETEKLPSYNADQAEGVSYEMDLTRPVGDRVRDLTFHGKPLDPAQTLRVAINSYRYTGGGGYFAYKGLQHLPVLFRSALEIRDLVIEYLGRTQKIPTDAVGNWKIVPPEAVAAIEKVSDADVASATK